MDDHEAIRAKAHELWESEGRPEGRAARHWEQAKEIVALKGGAGQTARRPVAETVAEPVEPAAVARGHGDVPGLTDLGDEGGTPSREKASAIAQETPPGQSAADRAR